MADNNENDKEEEEEEEEEVEEEVIEFRRTSGRSNTKPLHFCSSWETANGLTERMLT